MSVKMRLKQYFGALLASFGGFALGVSIAWNSSVSYQLNDTGATIFEIGFIGFILNIGACFGSICAPFILKIFGFTNGMFLMVPLFLIGWSFISFSRTKIIYMLIGRLICGICGGILCVLTPIYIGEIADKEIRNRLLTFLHLLINCGIMYAFVIDYFMEEHKIIWQYSLICSISCAPIAFIIFLPESSFYYLTKNDEIMAKKSLQRYRNNFDDFSEELEELKSLATIYKSKVSSSIFKNIKVWRSFSATIVSILTHQFSLINVIIFYAFSIFELKYPSGDFDTNETILIIGSVQIAASVLAIILIDLIGRRKLLIFSSMFMGIFLALLGWFMKLQKENIEYSDKYYWVPLTCICLYFASFNCGIGPLAWTLHADSFPVEMKLIGSSVVVFLSWSMSLIAILILYMLIVFYDAVTTVFIFASFSWIGSIFLFFLIRETKGKSLANIQLEFGFTN
ncbi:facilitated trehalose transporter Tret1-like [Leptopilina boulardi]|uniref:facilitated trehalose transporter Tret1-like n=1 Tax=Leptopilina boulardi TaxID=63433 RepID=UPI0021F63105|nr:facilitated trehalose transporter Tret1-like [Leptopilina boulardi]